MSEKPEALRLADELERDKWHVPAVVMQAAADELRRLSVENEALRRERDEARRTVREAHEAGTRLTAQRDALLGLLKEARKIIRATSSRNLVKDWDRRTTAAIKAVEENT